MSLKNHCDLVCVSVEFGCKKLDEGRFEGEKMQKETCTVYDSILCGSRRNILKHRKNDG